MKKLLLILTAGCISVSAFCQTTATGDNKPVRDTKTGSLNGKTFKITFGEQTISQKQGTPDSQSMNDKGTVTRDDMNNDYTVDQGVKNEQGKKHDQNHQQGMDNETMNKNNGTEGNNTDADRAMIQDNRNTQMDYSAYEHNKKGKTAEITFTDTEIQCAKQGEGNNDAKSCPYTVSASSSNMISFYANCSKDDSGVNSQYTGFVEDKSIKGSMTYAMPDGRTVRYDFKGTAITTKKKQAEGSSGISQ